MLVTSLLFLMASACAATSPFASSISLFPADSAANATSTTSSLLRRRRHHLISDIDTSQLCSSAPCLPSSTLIRDPQLASARQRGVQFLTMKGTLFRLHIPTQPMGICLYYTMLMCLCRYRTRSIHRPGPCQSQRTTTTTTPSPRLEPAAIFSMSPRPYDFGATACAHRWDKCWTPR